MGPRILECLNGGTDFGAQARLQGPIKETTTSRKEKVTLEVSYAKCPTCKPKARLCGVEASTITEQMQHRVKRRLGIA